MRRSVNLRRKIRGALAYPMMLLMASLGMVAFLTVYVVPRMSSLFEGFGRNKLPWLTLIVTGIADWVTRQLLVARPGGHRRPHRLRLLGAHAFGEDDD